SCASPLFNIGIQERRAEISQRSRNRRWRAGRARMKLLIIHSHIEDCIDQCLILVEDDDNGVWAIEQARKAGVREPKVVGKIPLPNDFNLIRERIGLDRLYVS